jgi:hypothetical protein
MTLYETLLSIKNEAYPSHEEEEKIREALRTAFTPSELLVDEERAEYMNNLVYNITHKIPGPFGGYHSGMAFSVVGIGINLFGPEFARILNEEMQSQLEMSLDLEKYCSEYETENYYPYQPNTHYKPAYYLISHWDFSGRMAAYQDLMDGKKDSIIQYFIDNKVDFNNVDSKGYSILVSFTQIDPMKRQTALDYFLKHFKDSIDLKETNPHGLTTQELLYRDIPKSNKRPRINEEAQLSYAMSKKATLWNDTSSSSTASQGSKEHQNKTESEEKTAEIGKSLSLG